MRNVADTFSSYFTNTNTGWITGTSNTLLNTTNGGLNWIKKPIPNTYCAFNSIIFFDANTGYFGGYNIFYSTTNGGNNFSMVYRGDIRSIYFSNFAEGFICDSSNFIKRTTNYCSSWSKVFSSPSSNILESIYFPNINSGVCVGTGGLTG